MGDPNMDTGVDLPPHAVFDPLQTLTPNDVLWIMDEMLSLEVSHDPWHF